MRRKSSFYFPGGCQFLLILLQICLLGSQGVVSSPVVRDLRATKSTNEKLSVTKTIGLAVSSKTSGGDVLTSTLPITSTTFTPVLDASPTTLKTAPIATETSAWSNKRVIQPSFFYEGGWRIRCASTTTAYNAIVSYLNGEKQPLLQEWGITQDNWNRILGEHSRLAQPDAHYRAGAEMAEIHERQRWCEFCLCDEDGKIIRSGPAEYRCASRLKAIRCAIFYATLGQPRLQSDTMTLEDVRQAINRIPYTVRGDRDNQNWWWQVDDRIASYPGQVMRFSDVDPALSRVNWGAGYPDTMLSPNPILNDLRAPVAPGLHDSPYEDFPVADENGFVAPPPPLFGPEDPNEEYVHHFPQGYDYGQGGWEGNSGWPYYPGFGSGSGGGFFKVKREAPSNEEQVNDGSA
ncbi:hypothetical protein TWF481_010135 [Arthrobotrys musiformis]|uniref:Uncharacterized protein n=1 Tax=Arthrobotrys musiformis TaxID=47236 RepID=A0AAV9W005_9PEZI